MSVCGVPAEAGGEGDGIAGPVVPLQPDLTQLRSPFIDSFFELLPP